jgi:hypothetical protein
MLHVYGDYVVPSSRTEQTEYEIRVIDSICDQAEIDDPAIAPPLELATSLWGDVCGPFVNGVWPAADGLVTVVDDVMAVLAKWANRPNALSKTRADVVSTNPLVWEKPGGLQPDHVITIPDDVNRVLGAFTLRPFPFQDPLGPWLCPSGCPAKETAGAASRR